MPRIKAGRTVQLASLCDFNEAEQAQKDSKPLPTNSIEGLIIDLDKDQTRPLSLLMKELILGEDKEVNASIVNNTMKCSLAKEMTCLENNTRDGILKNVIGTPTFVQNNQAKKRQKSEDGRSRIILNVKPQVLLHKLRPDLSSSIISSTVNAHERKVYVREPAAPFVSMAKMMNKFQSGTRNISLPPRCNTKRQVNERIPVDLFDKMSITSEPRHEKQLPRVTKPNPFNLRTEERGAEKEKKFVMEVVRKQKEEEIARIPKATPYPLTTDSPEKTLKPEPKSCTQTEPFQLESLARHEEEMQRKFEERQRMEMEEAQKRLFKAQPILKQDPIPEMVRKPLTEVKEFNLHVDHRAVNRAQFNKMLKEKEIMYKRYRDEAESAKMMEEEKALKQLRRTLVMHARPVPNFSHSARVL